MSKLKDSFAMDLTWSQGAVYFFLPWVLLCAVRTELKKMETKFICFLYFSFKPCTYPSFFMCEP